MASHIGRVPEPLIQDMLSRVEIGELVGRYVTLKKSGQNLSGLCPFHHEKTPSFTVSTKKQFYHCFGCGAHGDAIAFLMEYQGLSFVEALESLADQLGMELPRAAGSPQPKEDLKPIYQALKQAAIFYHQQWKRPEAKPFIEYLKERGLTKDLINQFAIGFVPEGWDHLCKHLQGLGISQQVLLQAGLASEGKKGGVYDKFRNRVMYPIRDIKGRVLGFGGRALGDDIPKYLNSPETPVFQKSDCLYGLFEAKFRGARVILVEGYMDVIALAEHGFCAMATLGTALNENHLKHVFRYFDHVVFCFDGDKAGKSAAWKACLEAMPLKTDNRQIDFVHLPLGQDPDTFIRGQGPKLFEKMLDEAAPFSDYFFQGLSEGNPPTTLDKRALLVKKGTPLLEQLPKGVFKSMMFEKLHSWKHARPKRKKPPPKGFSKKGRLKKTHSPSETLALMLLQHPEWLALVDEPSSLGQGSAGYSSLQKIIALIQQSEVPEPETVQKAFLEEAPEWAVKIKTEQWEMLSEEAFEEEFLGVITRLNQEKDKKRLEILLEKAKNGELGEQERQILKDFYNKGN